MSEMTRDTALVTIEHQ